METTPKGYLHSQVDVKVLILFILARIEQPLSGQELYEVAYQDDSLNYFMFFSSLPELVATGHLRQDAEKRYAITELGRTQGAQVEDSLAVPVVEKVSAAIAQKLAMIRRSDFIKTAVLQDDHGNYQAILRYQVDEMPGMELSLHAPNESVAQAMAENLRKRADELYRLCYDAALQEGRQAP